jgi:hypothetical protein
MIIILQQISSDNRLDLKVLNFIYNLNMNADVDGDGQIGKAEVLYILMETGVMWSLPTED